MFKVEKIVQDAAEQCIRVWLTRWSQWISNSLKLPLPLRRREEKILHLAWRHHNQQVHKEHLHEPRRLRRKEGCPHHHCHLVQRPLLERLIQEIVQGSGCQETREETDERPDERVEPHREHVQVRALRNWSQLNNFEPLTAADNGWREFVMMNSL